MQNRFGPLFLLSASLGVWPACTRDGGDADEPEGCDVPTETWDSECFATEIAGRVTGRGWADILSEFDPSTPDIEVVISPEGLLESVAGLSCSFRCESMGFGEPLLDGEFGEIQTIIPTCTTSYLCGGYPLELAIKGSVVTPEWEGALWTLYAHVGAYAYEGAPFEFGSLWNLGRADVPYEGCVPICESAGAECGQDGCGDLCGSCPNGYCDYATHQCIDDRLCTTDDECEEGEHCETTLGYCITGSCVSSGSCTIDPCCSDSTCVITGGGSECLQNCTSAGQCESDCCWPLAGGGSVCVDAAYCAACAQANTECSPRDNPCCPGAACVWDDFLGRSNCEPQSAECPEGCTNPYGVSCCRPPFCDGDCIGSPCCN